MSWRANPDKQEMILRMGQTAGLPLFEQDKITVTMQSRNQGKRYRNMPDWIWTGSGIKAEVFHSMEKKFAEDSFEYLNAIIMLGGNATDHEVKEYFNDVEKWPLHIVAARRNYFTGHPYYIITSYPDKTITGPKGKPNTIWYVDFTQLYKIIMEV